MVASCGVDAKCGQQNSFFNYISQPNKNVAYTQIDWIVHNIALNIIDFMYIK